MRLTGKLPPRFNADWSVLTIFVRRRLREYSGTLHNRRGANDKLKTVKSVAVILKREFDSTIKEWLRHVKLVPSLVAVPLSDAERAVHLPKLFEDVLNRLRLARGAEPLHSTNAFAHGKLRFSQGYSVPMLVEESRIFQVTSFGTLHRHQNELDQNRVLSDVIIIADEADRQLTETVRSFMTAQQDAVA